MRAHWSPLLLTAFVLGLIACAGPASRPVAPAGPAPTAPAATPAGPAPRVEPPPRHAITAAYVPSLSFIPLFLAIEKGYLAEEGIDLDLQVVQSTSNAVAFLGNGQIDAAFGQLGDALLNGIHRGLEIRIVAGLSYNPDASVLAPSALLVAKELWDSGAVRAPADLRGRRVALNTTGGVVEYQINKGLERGGITVRDVELVPIPFPDMPVALRNGAVDAALMPDPFSTVAREQGIAVPLVANPAPDLLVTMLQYGPNLLGRDREAAAQAFLRALRRAGNELLTPEQILTDEHVAIWAKHSGVAEAMIRKVVPYRFARDLAVDVASLLDQQRYLIQQGRLEYDQPLPAERLVDMRLAVRK